MLISPYHGRPLYFSELKESEDERIKKFPVNIKIICPVRKLTQEMKYFKQCDINIKINY